MEDGKIESSTFDILPRGRHEGVLPTFIHVRRGLVDASRVKVLFERLVKNSKGEHTKFTEADRLAILDFPNTDILTVSLATATDVSKQPSLERAALTPEHLTAGELQLLNNRY